MLEKIENEDLYFKLKKFITESKDTVAIELLEECSREIDDGDKYIIKLNETIKQAKLDFDELDTQRDNLENTIEKLKSEIEDLNSQIEELNNQ